MSKPTKTYLGREAREKILKGVNAIYDPIKLALGPAAGRALMYRTYGRGPRITEDGNTIVSVIEPKNEAEKLVADAFKEATNKTNEKAGDGTTTTTVIAGHLINEIFSKLQESAQAYAINGNVSVQETRRKLLALSKEVQEKIKECSNKIETLEDLEKVAIVSMGDEEVGKIVAKVVWEVGTDGFVDVVDGYKGELETEVIKGARFPAKPGAKAFLNNPKRFEMIVEDYPVFLTNYKFDNEQQARQTFERLLKTTKKLCVIAPDFSDQVLYSMVQTVKAGVFIMPVKVPSLRTEQFEDLAIYFGAKFIDKNTGQKLGTVEERDLGFVEKLVVKDEENREDAIALGGRGCVEAEVAINELEAKVTSPVSDRIAVLKSQIIEERIESHKKLLERRIASLASAVGVIRVGASTSSEALPLKLKIEDAQYACKAAMEEGYVKGGGLCLKEIADEMPDSIVSASLRAPYEQIQSNNEGPLEIGDEIIDPTKVVRLAVKHAIEVAANLITVKILIPEIEEQAPAEGYYAIATALNRGNALVAKKEGIMKENLDEMNKDLMQKFEDEDGRD